MTSVSRVSNTEPKKTERKKTEQAAEQTQPKSADIKSTQPSERAKNINSSEEIKDGTFKSRSDATLGDIAQANSMKEDGTVDPAEVQSQMVQMANDNPALKAAAEKAGINLEDPSEEDLQKLANLDVKAGQEIKCPAKAEEAKAAEEAAKPEEAAGAEEAGAEEPAGAEAAKGAEEKKADESPMAQIMAMIEKAETATDPAQKRQYADQAIQMINQIRNEKGVEKGQGQENQQATNTQGTQGAKNAEGQQLAKTIESGGKVDTAALDKAMDSKDLNQLSQILDSLEMRANKAKNGGGETMNALNLQGQNALNQMNMKSIQLPMMNQAIA